MKPSLGEKIPILDWEEGNLAWWRNISLPLRVTIYEIRAIRFVDEVL